MNVSLVKPLMTLREERAASTESNEESSGIADFFFRWDRLLHTIANAHVHPDSFNIQAELPAAHRAFEHEMEQVKASIMRQVVTARTKAEKELLIHATQGLLIHLLNKLPQCSHTKEIADVLSSFYAALQHELQGLLNFLKNLFEPYFNGQARVPLCLIAENIDSIRSAFENLPLLSGAPDSTAASIPQLLVQHLESLSPEGSDPLSFYDLWYYKTLLRELQALGEGPAEQAVREVLYFLNYNETAFVGYECHRLWELLKRADSTKHKIGLLRQEQKRINQLPQKLNCRFTETLPSLKEQINTWINEEINYLESGDALLVPESEAAAYPHKIHTSLSVAKLALLLRLLVLDKIIINRAVSPMLRIAAGVFTTLQKDEISFGSLETKYHAPDKTTIIAVRDLLFKWINILGRL